MCYPETKAEAAPAASAGTEGQTEGKEKRVTLKAMAGLLDLSPSTLSIVLNQSPVARAIPQRTQDRIFELARRLGYQPNHTARSLKSRRSMAIGVLLPELGESSSAAVLSGLEARLSESDYFCLVASQASRVRPRDGSLARLQQRSVDGLILIAPTGSEMPRLPTVTVSGSRPLAGVTNIGLDHDRAAQLVLEHLVELGHRRIAFFKGPPTNSDAAERWRALESHAARLGLEISPERTAQVDDEPPERWAGFQQGFAMAERLLRRDVGFTALCAYDDATALGASRALRAAGLHVPRDVSVVGFDDVRDAELHQPGLTTVRRPLHEMGRLAARTMLRRLESESELPDAVTVAPELVIRASTDRPRRRAA